MSIRFTRLGAGDWLIGPASLVLIVLLFAFPWFGVHANYAATIAALGGRVNANGWQTFTAIGPLTVIVCALGMLSWLLQLTRPTPALGILITIVLAPFTLVLLLWMIARVLVFPPDHTLGAAGTGNSLVGKPAAYIAVVLAAVVVVGVLLSLRREGIDPADTPSRIETFPLD